MRLLRALAVVVLVLLAGAAAAVYSGIYDVAADVPHSAPVYRLLQAALQRSIAAHARDVAVPPLDEAQRISAGAEHYAAMCAGCHLAPGAGDTEIRRGLYPQPPKLAEAAALPPAQAFWVIKHGIKLTAMPAWGRTHDDAAIWNIVAFLQKLPHLSADDYRQMTAAAGHEHHHEHAPADAAEHEHDHDAPPDAG